MFVQVIQGKVSDAAALRERFELWQEELQPGAAGYLGSTFGVTAEGEAIGIARFESADAADRNSARPEQGEWWAGTEKLFDGPVTFHDSSEVDFFAEGDPDQAGFVQVMQGTTSDLAKLREVEARALPMLAQQRPDVIGSLRANYGDGGFSEFIYFRSEAEARAGEKQELPSDAAEIMAEMDGVMTIDRYIDITDPWLFTP